MNDVNGETEREHYLNTFQRQNAPIQFFDGYPDEVGEKIVALLKEEDLTHDGAYASLQYAYNKIKYESNFLKLS